MATVTTTPLRTSNLRTSSRQTRTNPTRTSKTVGSSLKRNSLISSVPITPINTTDSHGFYPAITHFTDAINALPREFRRHTSLLKEVDAKAWAPEENLQALLSACVAAKPPRGAVGNLQPPPGSTPGPPQKAGQAQDDRSPAGHVADNSSQNSLLISTDPLTLRRRQLFYNLRRNLTEMMVTMDEKNHVINNANEELSRHLRRLDHVYPFIADEVSEEARMGSLTHWAYMENRPVGKATTQTGRREAATGLAIMHETNVAARSERRREALAARKERHTHVDSDFDEARVGGRRVNGNGKSKRIDEIAAESGLGQNTNAPPAKRKRTHEKPIVGGITMDRSLSGAPVMGRTLSREPSQQESVAKKRKAPTSAAAASGARKKINTNTLATDSPRLVSSPLAGAFGKDVPRASPVPSSARPPPSRARQNPTQATEGSAARPAPPLSRKNTTNGNGVTVKPPDVRSVASLTGKAAAEVKNTMKETANRDGARLIEADMPEQPAIANGDGVSLRGGVVLERTNSKIDLKREADTREESVPSKTTGARASPRLPPPSLANTTEIFRAERMSRGRTSKTATPIVSTFVESTVGAAHELTSGFFPKEPLTAMTKSKRPPAPRPRSRMKDVHTLTDSLSPTGLPVKRSHKKGAGLAAQAAALQAKIAAQRVEEETTSVVDGDDDEDEEGDGEEERYCYCHGVSYGQMVACDARDCPTEWFHLECVGLEKAPGKNTKWYCDECKESLKKGKFGSVGGNGK